MAERSGRATPGPETSTFHRDEPEALVARMTELAAARRGWVNLSPGVVDEGAVPQDDGLFALFSGRGPLVPLCTWSPGEERRHGVAPASVGLQHRAGPKAVARLAALAHPVPSGWAVLQDHPRRGLVLRVAPETTPGEALVWLLAAGERLCAVPVTGWWFASVFPGT